MSTMQLAIDTSAIAWAWLPLNVMGAVLTGGLHVRQQFVFATLVQPLPIVGALLGCLLFHSSIGVRALAWGQLWGSLAMTGAMMAVLRLRPSPRSAWLQTIAIARGAPLTLTALLVFIASTFSDVFWGATASPVGVPLLGYAQRIVIAIAGLAVTGASTVIFPRLSQYAAFGADSAFRDDFGRSLRTLLALITPLAAVFSVLALPIAQLLFVRGAFSQTEARELATLLPGMFTGMVAVSGVNLYFKALFAQRRVREAAAISAIGAAVYFGLSGLLAKPLGLPGIGIAYAVSWWLVFLLSAQLQKNGDLNNTGFILRLLGVTAISSGAAWFGHSILSTPESGSVIRQTMILMVEGLSAGFVFLAASLIWPGLDEIRLLVQALSRKRAS